MDQNTLLGVMAAIRRALNEFVTASDDPVRSLQDLSDEIDRLFSVASAKLVESDRDIANELQAILIDQIALMLRSGLDASRSINAPRGA